MRTLNGDAADALRPFSPTAVTDVTGFGLLGHAYELADRSGVRVVARRGGALPALPGALELAADGVRTGGDRRNREYAGPHVESAAERGAAEALAYDPQTAGGLLVVTAGREVQPCSRRRSRRAASTSSASARSRPERASSLG